MNLYIIASLNPCYVILVDNARILDIKIPNMKLMETIDFEIQELCNRINRLPSDLRSIYVDVGPGNLTSLKISISFALGLCACSKIALWTFSSFDLFPTQGRQMILRCGNNAYIKEENKMFVVKNEDLSSVIKKTAQVHPVGAINSKDVVNVDFYCHEIVEYIDRRATNASGKSILPFYIKSCF